MGSCDNYQSKMLFSLDPPSKLIPYPESDMSKIIYNTQGKVVTETLMTQYFKQFAGQCKHDSTLQYGKYLCAKACENNLSTDYVSKKITDVKYYNVNQ